MTNWGRQEVINRQRMQMQKLKAFVISVSIIAQHRCPSCDAADVVEDAIRDLEIRD